MHWAAFWHDVVAVAWLATWGNNTAAVEWAVAVGVAGYLGRHKIGRHVAAWWDKHSGPHAVKRHKQALREHEAEKTQRGEDAP